MVSCTVCRKVKGRAKVEVSTASATTVEKVEKQKERERRETAKVGMTAKVGQSERDGQTVTGLEHFRQRFGSTKGQQEMNNFERDSKQHDVLVMEMSTQEKTMRDSDWCVPVKHVAKLNRKRGQTSTKDRHQIPLLIQRKRTETMTQHRIIWDQNSSTLERTMSVTNAVVVRLMALGGSEREISPPRSQVYVFPA